MNTELLKLETSLATIAAALSQRSVSLDELYKNSSNLQQLVYDFYRFEIKLSADSGYAFEDEYLTEKEKQFNELAITVLMAQARNGLQPKFVLNSPVTSEEYFLEDGSGLDGLVRRELVSFNGDRLSRCTSYRIIEGIVRETRTWVFRYN